MEGNSESGATMMEKMLKSVMEEQMRLHPEIYKKNGEQ